MQYPDVPPDLRALFAPGRGLLVVGHGTADPIGAAETLAVARLAAEMLPGVPVEAGYLEVIGPSIGAAVARLAERGCRELVAAPLLLFFAGHAARDVPAALAEAAAASGLAIRQAEPLGCHAAVVDLSRRRRLEAVAALPAAEPDATILVMVGRGSSDPQAREQLDRFARATVGSGEDRCRRIELGFVAAARPTLDEALAAARDSVGSGVRRVVVQPHLLFRGHVEEQVTGAVDRARQAAPHLEWVQAARLGADTLVARALLARAAGAAR